MTPDRTALLAQAAAYRAKASAIAHDLTRCPWWGPDKRAQLAGEADILRQAAEALEARAG